MFERYTERARRALFFARYELSHLGGRTITTEHILLALLREPNGLVGRIFEAWNIPLPDLRRQLEAHARHGGDAIPTSVEVPFSQATKRVLNFAAEEADRLLHKDVESEHLLLGLLRETDSFAATTLTGAGVSVDEVRVFIADQGATALPGPREAARSSVLDAATHALASTHIQRITELVRDLAKAEPNSDDSRALIDRIDDELMMLQQLLG